MLENTLYLQDGILRIRPGVKRAVVKAVGKTLGMRASRLATTETVELAFASLSWSGAHVFGGHAGQCAERVPK